MDELKAKALKWATPLLIALVGALARQAQDYQERREFSWRVCAARLVIAFFSGLLVSLLSAEFGMSKHMTAAVAGVAGYSGVEAIEAVRTFVRGRYSQ